MQHTSKQGTTVTKSKRKELKQPKLDHHKKIHKTTTIQPTKNIKQKPHNAMVSNLVSHKEHRCRGSEENTNHNQNKKVQNTKHPDKNQPPHQNNN